MSSTQTLAERPRNLAGIIPVINHWKFLVLGLTLAALVISAIVSLLLPNEYKSTTVFYPTRFIPTPSDPIAEGDKMEFAATSEDIDRIITIGESQPLAEYIINKYQLYKDYGFEKMDDDESKQGVFDSFNSNLKIVHNERDAVEVTFYSEDKAKAAAVANNIVSLIDSMNQQLSIENRSKLTSLYDRQVKFLNKEISEMQDSLARARKKYGIFVSEKESRYLGEAVIRTQTELVQAKGELESLAKAAGNSDARVVALKAKVNGLESAYNSLVKGNSNSVYNMPAYMAGVDIVNDLQWQVKNLSERFVLAKTVAESVKYAVNGKVSTIYVVQKAYPATRKAKPIRWLIVAGSTILAFILSVAFVSLYELYKREMRRAAL